MKKNTFYLFLLLIFFINLSSFSQRSASLGDLESLNSIAGTINSTRLDDDKVLIVYRDQASPSVSANLIVVVATVSGSTISLGTPATVATFEGIINFPRVVALSPFKAVVVWEKNPTSGNDELRYNVLDINETSITVGTEGQFSNAAIERSFQASISMIALNSNQIAASLEITPNQFAMVAGTVSGSTITWGTTNTSLTSNNITNTSLTRLSDIKFAVAYEDNGSAADGMIVAGSIDGSNTITFGTPELFEFTASAVGYVRVIALSETEVAIAYEDDGGTDQGRLLYATLSGTDFTFPGSESTFFSGGSISEFHMDALSSSEVVIAIDGGSGINAEYYTASLSGNNFTVSSATTFLTSQADDVSVNALTSDLAMITYTDDAGVDFNTDFGAARLLTLSATTNPEINVQGSSTNIVIGDATPSSLDDTDFGTGAMLSKTFTIQNLGTGTLNLGSNSVSISGTNASDFTVSSQPSTTVSGSGSTTFTVTFSSEITSTRSAQINIQSNDLHEPNYFFSIQAVGAVANLTWNGSSDNNWNTASNWTPASVPSEGSSVTIPSGLTNYPTSTGVVSINSLTIQPGATLIAIGSFTTTGSSTYQKTLTNAGQWYLLTSPVIGETYDDAWVSANNIASGTSFTTNRGISTYDNSSSTSPFVAGSAGHWRYMQSGGNGTFNSNQGYGIVSSASSNTLSFIGSGLHTSVQTFGVTQGINNFNLIGNPYTAFLTLGTIYTTNNSVIGTDFYFWDGGSTYVTRTSGAHSSYEIEPGLAFFIEASAAANITFETSDLSHEGSISAGKTSNIRPEINLHIKEGINKSFATILYIDGTTTGYDLGYDGKLFGGVNHSFAIYSDLIQSDGKKYQLQTLPNKDHENMVVPIGIISNAGKEITFSAETLNLPSGLKIFLEDRENNTVTRLDEANASYKVTLNNALEGSGRFFLHTRSSALSTDDASLMGVGIYTVNKNTLRISGVNSSDASVKVYNILGRKVVDQNFSSKNVYDVSLPKLNTGVYIVQLSTEKGKMSKKIVLE